MDTGLAIIRPGNGDQCEQSRARQLTRFFLQPWHVGKGDTVIPVKASDVPDKIQDL